MSKELKTRLNKIKAVPSLSKASRVMTIFKLGEAPASFSKDMTETGSVADKIDPIVKHIFHDQSYGTIVLIPWKEVLYILSFKNLDIVYINFFNTCSH